MKKMRAALFAALIIAAFGGCDFLLGPDEPLGSGGGNLNVRVGTGDREARAVMSGAELPGDVRASLRYEITLTGPGGETIERSLADGENLKLTAALGEWRIAAAARQDGIETIVGTGSLVFTVLPGINAVRVPMALENYYHSITLAGPANGTVQADPLAAFPGTLITLTATPDPGYMLKAGSLVYSYGDADYPVDAGGEDVPAEGAYTFTMPPADIRVSAEFEPLPPDPYIITAAALSHGTLSADPASAPEGTLITLTVTPDPGYVLKRGSLIYSYGGADYPVDDPVDENGGDAPAESGAGYTFTMPASDLTVYAEFNRDLGFVVEGPQDEMIPVSAVHSGGHTPPTDISWSGDESIIFTVDSPGYSVEDGNLAWMVNGSIQTSTGNSITIYARDYVMRRYTLTAMIKERDQWYSGELDFTVTR
jgi:hypothetical protein